MSRGCSGAEGEYLLHGNGLDPALPSGYPTLREDLMSRRSASAWFALAALLASGLADADPASDCHPPALGHVPFSYGEKIEYDIDLLGARLGSLVLSVHPGHPPDAFSITGRAQTDSLAGDFYSVDAVA